MNDPRPGASPPAPALAGAVEALIREAEAASAEIDALRARLGAAELRRRKLYTAIDAAAQALAPGAREALGARLAALAERIRPRRGRPPDTRLEAIIERLAELAHHDEAHVKVAEMHAHLERLGFRSMPHGYASNALGRLAGRGFVVKVAYGRFRINDVHPELVALRFRLLDADIARRDAREAELREAERRGRRLAGRR